MTRHALLAGATLVLATSGCATLRQVAALEDVDFRLDGVRDVRLAGIELSSVRGFHDLAPGDLARVTSAVALGELPLSFDLHVEALNPAENEVTARLLDLDWTLLLEDVETIEGSVDGPILLPPGNPTDIPIPMRLDLVEFFDGSARDLVDLALAVAGRGAERRTVTLRAVPTVDTPVGPIRYPRPITIVREEVGG